MGFSNGTSKTDKRVQKGGHGSQGERGIGFHLHTYIHTYFINVTNT